MIVKPITPAKGEMEDGEFLFPVRVYYEDTEDDLEKEEKTGWVVRHCEIDYLKPAVLEDELMVTCKITNLGGVTAVMHQEILRGNEVLVVIDVKVAHLSLETKKPVRIPRDLLSRMG